MQPKYRAWLAGAKAELPIIMGGIPFGIIYGVTALKLGLSPWFIQAMSTIVFGGSSQMIIAQMFGSFAPNLAIILTSTVVNLRHALYSASLAPYVQPLSRWWKVLLAYLLTDEAYAVAITNYQERNDPEHGHWFFFGAGFMLWISWQVSTAIGILVGSQLPPMPVLDIAAALTFIGILIPILRDKALIAAAITGASVAVLASGLPYKLDLMAAAVVGIGVGLAIEGKQA
ncbi:AzlC family ABC transporter permease [Herpetosiphon sp. NSE202]|uniref:AzlC family ABC transporter permease n=1 Tax=Herpetosiphon sp. NSE202 TaxID=3351349 RepID=UPI00363A0117